MKYSVSLLLLLAFTAGNCNAQIVAPPGRPNAPSRPAPSPGNPGAQPPQRPAPSQPGQQQPPSGRPVPQQQPPRQPPTVQAPAPRPSPNQPAQPAPRPSPNQPAQPAPRPNPQQNRPPANNAPAPRPPVVNNPPQQPPNNRPPVGNNPTTVRPVATTTTRRQDSDNPSVNNPIPDDDLQNFPLAPTIAPPPQVHFPDSPQMPVFPPVQNPNRPSFPGSRVGEGRFDARCPRISDPRNPVSFPHDTDCARFFACENGLAFESRCPEGLHFNAQRSMCDFPGNAGCLNGGPVNRPQPLPPTNWNPNPGYVHPIVIPMAPRS